MISSASPAQENSNSSLPLTLVVAVSYLYPALLYGFLSWSGVTNPTARYLTTIGSAIFLGGLALWALRKDRSFVQGVELNFKRLHEALMLLAAGWLCFGLVYYLFAGENWLATLADPLKVIQQWLFVGIAEELLFRGYLLNRFRYSFRRLPKSMAVLSAVGLSSLIFATIHIPVRLYNQVSLEEMLISMALLFLMGILFSYFYLRTNNILLGGLFHGSWNVPLIGVQGDFLLAIVFALVIEIGRVILSRVYQRAHEETGSTRPVD